MDANALKAVIIPNAIGIALLIVLRFVARIKIVRDRLEDKVFVFNVKHSLTFWTGTSSQARAF